MVGRLKSLWRGEIQLQKTFWLFGIVTLLLFSFTFIVSQEIIAAITGKVLNAPFYFDCFLVFIFIVYGIFIIVSIWRSANKYRGHRKWSRLAKVTSIIFVLWFGANMGLYLVVKTAVPPALEAVADYIPVKLKIPESEIEADSLYFGNFKSKFPFYKEDIREVSPFLMEHRLRIVDIFLNNEKGMIDLNEIPDNMPEVNPSIRGKIENWLVGEQNYRSYFRTMGLLHYAKLKDYSWWNLRSNLRLAVNLVLKAIAIPAFGDSKVYEVETPYLKGYLRKGQSKKNNTIIIHFEFEGKGKSYTVLALTTDKNVASKVMTLISTIQPVAEIDKSYAEIEALYKHKDKLRYPEELLLLSLISIKGPTIDNMNDLLKIEESKKKNQYAIDSIRGEIDFLRRAKTHSPG
jgi:hypothetical protein